MAIRIIPNPTFRARVQLTVPGEPDAAIEFVFRHKSPKALTEWHQTFGDKTSAEALSEVVEKWAGGVIDENGDEVPYTPENFALFLAAHAPRAEELLETYLREVFESRRKNSGKPLAG